MLKWAQDVSLLTSMSVEFLPSFFNLPVFPLKKGTALRTSEKVWLRSICILLGNFLLFLKKFWCTFSLS